MNSGKLLFVGFFCILGTLCGTLFGLTVVQDTNWFDDKECVVLTPDKFGENPIKAFVLPPCKTEGK